VTDNSSHLACSLQLPEPTRVGLSTHMLGTIYWTLLRASTSLH